MYLVHDAEMECDVFLDDDPRSAGFAGEVVEGVSLEDDELEGPVWDHGSTRPQLLLAVAADDPKKFKVFSSEDEVANAGYRTIATTYAYDTTWSRYLRATGRGEP